MVAPDSERNLLFGLIALESGRVTREALTQGIVTWMARPGSSLGDVLVEQRALEADARSKILAEVDRILSERQPTAHDPHATIVSNAPLASLPAPGVEPESVPSSDADEGGYATADFTPPVSPDIHATHAPSATASFDAGSLAAPGPTSGAMRYRVVRAHARGGLGEVFVATDQELRREVALKEIQSRHAHHAESRARFLLEAEITGGLEHPGIVPVYGLGAYADGRPYYAMRFIRGESFKEAMDRFHAADKSGRDPGVRELEFRKLLANFIAVCNALEYAHSRGVLHRDIKPANIMLGKYGETLVVDWGLAKAVGREDIISESGGSEQLLQPTMTAATATVMGAAIGTPQYMSPEQAAGKIDELGPASDVYSMGATLFTLLTGKPPFEATSVVDILNKVRGGIFRRPREHNKAIPPALEAICLKAMSLSPAERYPTTGPLAADIEHWLADEQVTAYEEPWRERARRWLRRHRSWAQAGAATILLVAVTGVSASLLINRARERESLARRDAEESLLQARKAVDEFFTEVSESKLLNVPGLQPLRKDLLDIALAHYQEFISRHADDPSVREDLGRNYYRVGKITQIIGSKSDALDQFQKALAIQKELAGMDRGTPEQRFDLASTWNAIGDVELALGQVDQAVEAFGSSMALREELSRQFPRDVEYRRRLANSHNNLGMALAQQGRLEPAFAEIAKGNEARRTLVSEQPENLRFRRDLAQGCYNLGVQLKDHGDSAGAVDALRNAVDEFREIVDKDPNSIEASRELGEAWRMLGDSLAAVTEFSEAAAALDAAQSIAERLARQNPSLVELQADLASVYFSLGEVKEDTNQGEAAIEWFKRARDLRERLVVGDPLSRRFNRDLVDCLSRLGMAEMAADQMDEARRSYTAALEIVRPLAAANFEDWLISDAMAQILRNDALIYRARGERALAVKEFDEARQIYDRLAQTPAVNDAIQFGLADALLNVAVDEWLIAKNEAAQGNADKATKSREASMAALERARTIITQVVQAKPNISKYIYSFCEVTHQAGLAALDRKEFQQAAKDFEAEINYLSPLVEKQPENVKNQSLLGIAIDKLAVALWFSEQYQPAVEQARVATEHLKAAVDGAPKTIQYRLNLSENYKNRSTMARELDAFSEALALGKARRSLWPGDAAELYDVALGLARTAAIVGQDSPQLTPDQAREKGEIADEAVATLKEALAAGLPDGAKRTQDKAWQSLRERSDFPVLAPAPESK